MSNSHDKPDFIDNLIAARRLQNTLRGADSDGLAAPRPLDVVAPHAMSRLARRAVTARALRSAERQEEIDALEHGAMARRYA